ncbi:hypothetical protein [Miniimonas sp. S16]|uniref:hypothetical protein n=1 Tax=Miniimonas sp. S16 TaxID=2171623 RepID=UPI000D52A6F7|nr:hypothetical protein [Miniimonas sp. S16]
MSLLGAVLDSTRSGLTPARTADALGVPVGLVEAALDHWVRLGVVTPAGTLVGLCAGCGVVAVGGSEGGASAAGAGGADAASGAVCATCPFAR